MAPGASRNRLCRDAYLDAAGGNPLGLLQQALVMAEEAEPIEKLLRVEGVKTGRVTALDTPGQIAQARALGILSEAQSQLLLDYDVRIMHLINVDDFAPHELAAGSP